MTKVVHDVAIQNLPVRFAIDRAGLVGADGPTHAGAFDNAYLGTLPNMVMMAAADEAELKHMVATQAAFDDPTALRYPRGEGTASLCRSRARFWKSVRDACCAKAGAFACCLTARACNRLNWPPTSWMRKGIFDQRRQRAIYETAGRNAD